MKAVFLFGSLVLATVAPLAAQQRGVERRMFTYLDDNLTVEVSADAPGTLEIVRGEPGRIDVAGHVPGGVSASALGGRAGDKLRLTALGGTRADFIVTVPEDAYVRVTLPNHKAASLGSTRAGGTFTWDGSNGQPLAAAPPPPPTGPFLAHTPERTPNTVTIPQIANISRVDVHLGTSEFRVISANAMSVINGDPNNIVIQTGQQQEELQIDIPAGVRDFTLRLGGKTALTARFGEVSTYCEPVIEQQVGEAHWFTFSPQGGRITCR
jgi:hypothetical protein